MPKSSCDSKQKLQQYNEPSEDYTRELSSLLEISHNLASTLELKPLLSLMLDQLKKVVDYSGAAILTLENDELLKLLIYKGMTPPEKVRREWPLRQDILHGAVIRQGTPIILPNVHASTPLAQAFQAAVGAYSGPIHSWIGVPLIVRDRVLGMVSLDHYEINYYTPHRAKLALAFANQAAIAIENARLYTETRQRADEIQALFAVQQAITSRLDPDAVLQLIADEARRLTATGIGMVYLLDGDDLRLAVLSCDQPTEFFVGYRLPVNHSINGLAVQTRKSYVITDAKNDPRAYADGVRRAHGFSFVTVPMVSSGHPIGTIAVVDKPNGVCGPDDERVLTMLASSAVIGLENARLYKETRRRADEIQALFAVQQAITSRLELKEVLQIIADAACALTHAQLSTVNLLTDDTQAVELAVMSGAYDTNVSLGYRIPLDHSINGESIRTGRTIISNDTPHDPRTNLDVIQDTLTRSLLVTPLIADRGPLGTISAVNKRNGSFNNDDERVLSILASSAVIGLENARLYREEHERLQEAEKRRRVAEGLRDILNVLNSNRSLDEILNYIISQTPRLIGTTAVAIFRLENGLLSAQVSKGLPEEYVRQIKIPVGKGVVGRAINERQPHFVSDSPTFFASYDIEDPQRRAIVSQLIERYHSFLAVPLLIKDEVYGGIAFYYPEPREFTPEEIRLATAFADQTALAIENARLRAQSEQSAITAERSRLARDLHDAVTQTLFSASLIAEVLPLVWEQDADEGQRHLEDLRKLTRGALAEMRALLLELRPASLVETPLPDLLRQLVESVTGRTGLTVELSTEGQQKLLPDAQIAFYRIAQEALNNIAKHARASRVDMALKLQPDQATLTIKDNGRGFDPEAVPPDHHGLRIMRERAEAINACLITRSQPNQGTYITLTWPQ